MIMGLDSIVVGRESSSLYRLDVAVAALCGGAGAITQIGRLGADPDTL